MRSKRRPMSNPLMSAVITSTLVNPRARAPGQDELALRRRVRHGDDARGGVAGGEKQRERAPAAPELENRVPVRDACPLGREPQHALLRLAELIHIVWPPRGAVFQVRSEHQLEEGRRDLVVLLVGRFGRHRDGRTARARRERRRIARPARRGRPLPARVTGRRRYGGCPRESASRAGDCGRATTRRSRQGRVEARRRRWGRMTCSRGPVTWTRFQRPGSERGP